MPQVKKDTIVHVANVPLCKTLGMGRIAVAWLGAFEKHGWQFLHIGSEELPNTNHRSFPAKAYEYLQARNISPAGVVAHEPTAFAFARMQCPVFLVSHGIEQRYTELSKLGLGADTQVSLKTKIYRETVLRRRYRTAFSIANALLLSNTQDLQYAQDTFLKSADDCLVFRNGVTPMSVNSSERSISSDSTVRILFLGSWIARKGTEVLVKAAEILHSQNISVQWLLAGVGLEKSKVLADWPQNLHSSIEIIRAFDADEEAAIISRATIFVLPSYFEGQPLALLQAMAGGLCCISTDTCGQRDLISHKENGLLFPVGDSVQLAAHLRAVIESPKMASTLGQNAKESVRGRSWDSVSDEVVSYVKSRIERSER